MTWKPSPDTTCFAALLAMVVAVSCISGSGSDGKDSGDPDNGGSNAAGGSGDGSGGVDEDADGYASIESGGSDCDDINPDAFPGNTETWYDAVDGDCDGESDFDADGDGHESDRYGGDDCDDTDASVSPSAYDLPNDGIDQDCLDGDRFLDGMVLAEGTTETETRSVGAGVMRSAIDLAVVLDTTQSMAGVLAELSFRYIESDVTATTADVHYGFATFDDYPCCGYGYTANGDIAFKLHQQITDDLSALDTTVGRTSTHHGGDGPESGMEALYQALTGRGYDLGCDGGFDSVYDVKPFIASADDAFNGAGGQSYTSTSSGSGTLGGMGFRTGSIPVVAVVTDYDLRDPEAGYPTPGGCPFEAGRSDVATAAEALDAWIVGIQVHNYTSTPYTQLLELTGDLDRYVDSDDDGVYDNLPVYAISPSDINTTLSGAIDSIYEAEQDYVYAEVWLETDVDPYGLVADIQPQRYTSVSISALPLDFDIEWSGTLPARPAARTETVSFALYADGTVIDTFDVVVEIPPL